MIAPMVHVPTLPRNEGPTGWMALLPPRTPRPVLTGVVRADWTVLGAGFTGLAAARRLAEARPDDRIVVLDALAVGEGASGRNSGFAIDHAHTLGGGAAEAESAKGQKRLYTAAIEHLRDLVETYGIECDWRACGKYHAAVSARGADKYLRPLLAELDYIGEPHEWLNGEEICAATGIAHYNAGIYTPGTVLINPAALVRGLANHLPANVTLIENSPVTEILSGNAITLRTAQGEVVASRLILATNAFTPTLGFAANRLLPFAAFASLTAPMNDAEQAALGGKPAWGLTPANAFVAPTIQRTSEGRILYRDGILFRPGLALGTGELEKMRTAHEAHFRARFPMLEGLALEHTWGGYLCMSRNQDSVFGAVGENVWAAAGFQGIGVTRGTIAGHLVADMAMGLANPLMEDMMRIASPPTNPPRPFLDMGVTLRTAWEAWTERDER